MKHVSLSKLPKLAEHMATLDFEPILLTTNGKAVAAVVALPNTDNETASLASNAKFIALIQRSRLSVGTAGGVSMELARRELLEDKPRRPEKPRRRSGRPAAK
ncbi:MAG: hypothetical protein ACKVS9_09135 [Phycisphaerae bacterium]